MVSGQHHIWKVGGRQQSQHAHIALSEVDEVACTFKRESKQVKANDSVDKDPRENRHQNRNCSLDILPRLDQVLS